VRLLVGYLRLLPCCGSVGAHVTEDNDNMASRRVAEKTGFEVVDRFVDQDGTPMVRYQLGPRQARE
jgi:predicted acetyltransferase